MLDLNINLLLVLGLKDKGICIILRLGFLNLIRDSKTLVTARQNKGTYVLKLGSKNHLNKVVNRVVNKVVFITKANIII
jgi:hypothetical protein